MFISRLLVASVMSLFLSLNVYGVEALSGCPPANTKKNVFDASMLEGNSRISIENGTAEYPLVLDFYRPLKGGCKKIEFARYSIEGGGCRQLSRYFLWFFMVALMCSPLLRGI